MHTWYQYWLSFYFPEWLWGDYILYDYFKKEFFSKRKEFGLERLRYEKETLKNITEQTMKKCEHDKNDEFCRYFNLPEMIFLNKIKERQSAKSVRLLTKKYSELSRLINNSNTYFNWGKDWYALTIIFYLKMTCINIFI